MFQHRVRHLGSFLAVPFAFAIFALSGTQPSQGSTENAPLKGKILCTTSTGPQCGPLSS